MTCLLFSPLHPAKEHIMDLVAISSLYTCKIFLSKAMCNSTFCGRDSCFVDEDQRSSKYVNYFFSVRMHDSCEKKLILQFPRFCALLNVRETLCYLFHSWNTWHCISFNILAARASSEQNFSYVALHTHDSVSLPVHVVQTFWRQTVTSLTCWCAATFSFHKVSGCQSWYQMMVNDAAHRLLCPLHIRYFFIMSPWFMRTSDSLTEWHFQKSIVPMVHFRGLTRWNLIRKQENEVLLYNISMLIDE